MLLQAQILLYLILSGNSTRCEIQLTFIIEIGFSITSLRFINSLQLFHNLIRNKVRGRGGESYEAKTSVARQIALLRGMFSLLVTHLVSSFPKSESNVIPSFKMHNQPSFSSTAAHSALYSGYTHPYSQNKIHISNDTVITSPELPSKGKIFDNGSEGFSLKSLPSPPPLVASAG